MPVLRCAAALLAAVLPPLAAQGNTPPRAWRDASPHQIRFIAVENGVRLEVLDWGGSGHPLLLLAGGGNTAHIFDEFAPKITASCHVYGVTRRGFGASGFAPPRHLPDRLGEDVLAVIDALRLRRPILAGHSIAGAELSWTAASHPDRIAGLIYLEAGYPYAFYNGSGPAMKDFVNLAGPRAPAPDQSDLLSFTALQHWDRRTYGFLTPEAELRQTWESDSGDRPIRPRDPPGSEMLMNVLLDARRHGESAVPALIIFAVPHVLESWIRTSSDAAVHNAAATYSRNLDALTEKQVQVVRAVSTARVVCVPGSHYIFLTNEADVLKEMRAFLEGLK